MTITGIDGKPFIGFDDQLPMNELEALDIKICAGIARCKTRISSSVLEWGYKGHLGWLDLSRKTGRPLNANISYIAPLRSNSRPKLYEFTRSTLPSFIKDEKIIEEYSKLENNEQRRIFEQFALKAYINGQYLVLRSSKSETDPFAMFNEGDSFDTEDYQYFPELKNWISKLPFSQIGRILVFLSYNYLPGECHSDRRKVNGQVQEWYNGKYHFIHLNPFMQKTFYICDDTGKEVYYTDQKATFFNTNDLHGTLDSTVNTYSIKIEGQFTKEFAERNGIKWTSR